MGQTVSTGGGESSRNRQGHGLSTTRPEHVPSPRTSNRRSGLPVVDSSNRRLRRRSRLVNGIVSQPDRPETSTLSTTTEAEAEFVTPNSPLHPPNTTDLSSTSPDPRASALAALTSNSRPPQSPRSFRGSSYFTRTAARILPRYSTVESTHSEDDGRANGRAVRRRLADGPRSPTEIDAAPLADGTRDTPLEAPQTVISNASGNNSGATGGNEATSNIDVDSHNFLRTLANASETQSTQSGSIGRRRSRFTNIRHSLANLPFNRHVSQPDLTPSPEQRTPVENAPTPSISNTTTPQQSNNAESSSSRPSAPTHDIPSIPSPPTARQLRRGLPASERALRRLPTALRGGFTRPRTGEDQAAMLSRLLSHAAALTAVSLVGNNQTALQDAHDVGGDGGDGSFQSFLQTLENGRLAAALRNGGGMNGSPTGDDQAVNFFRMFRFGATGSQPRREEAPTSSSSSPEQPEASPPAGSSDQDDSVMVPVIIVGIRSMTAEEGAEREGGAMTPTFFDLLQNLATEEEPRNRGGGFLRRTDGSSRFGRMRRSSMGGSSIPGHESLGNGRSRDIPRPHGSMEAVDPTQTVPTVLSESPPGPHPPPSTPADLSLSALSSGTTTPIRRPSLTSASPNARDQSLRTPGANTTIANDVSGVAPRGVRRRRLSDSEFGRPLNLGSGSSRRNGIVGDTSDAIRSDGTTGRRNNTDSSNRSWIIYVLGGSYPEDHPILTTPSLFTDSPSYEDMLLLATLLGPAKPPVASEEEVASAAGLYRITRGENGILAVAVNHDGESLRIEELERCLVCLCDYTEEEELRKLGACGHFFHRECIDQWLTTGRNSCPLCRGQGVAEKKADKVEGEGENNSPEAAPETEATAD